MTTLVVGPHDLRDYDLVAHALDLLVEGAGVPVAEVMTLDEVHPNGVTQDAQRWAKERGLAWDEYTSGNPLSVEQQAAKSLHADGGIALVFLNGSDASTEALRLRGLVRRLRQHAVPVYAWDVVGGAFADPQQLGA